MMIVPVARKREQDHSVIKFHGDLVLTDSKAEDYHIDLTAITCAEPDCLKVTDCKGYVFPCGAATPSPRQLCHNGKMTTVKKEPTQVAPVTTEGWTLRYVASEVVDCTLRFDWCDLLWDLPPAIYNAVLFRCGVPCGRFRIQLRSGRVYGADSTRVTGCLEQTHVKEK